MHNICNNTLDLSSLEKVLRSVGIFSSDSNVGTGELPFGFVRSLSNNQEIETKIDILEEEDIRAAMATVCKLGIATSNFRYEIHDFFPGDGQDNVCRIAVGKPTEVWYKRKTATQLIRSPTVGIPFVTRIGEKFRPGHAGYSVIESEFANFTPHISFTKACFNVFFHYQTYLFSLSFSLAENPSGFSHKQMELEFEGHRVGSDAPSFDKVLSIFEDIVTQRFTLFQDRLTAVTKASVIMSKHSAQKSVSTAVAREDVDAPDQNRHE